VSSQLQHWTMIGTPRVQVPPVTTQARKGVLPDFLVSLSRKMLQISVSFASDQSYPSGKI